ncbi:MAG TPA: hypothetical protein VGD81_15465 [Opitutaceae bacterium]
MPITSSDFVLGPYLNGMNATADSSVVMVPVRKPRISSRADIEDLAIAVFWRDTGDKSHIGQPLSFTRAKMREHALRWASRRRARAVRMPYAA